ncbi:MAG: peptidyl-prolyl cis-trans isomerase [Acidimicrobiales bacterium]
MKRSALVLAVCCLVALTASCSKKSATPAATVNGAAIPAQAVVDELDAISGNAAYLSALSKSEEQQGRKVQGATPGSFDTAFATVTLREQIYFRLLRDEVAKQHLVADAPCTDAARNEVYSRVGFSDPAAGKATFEQFPQAYQATLVERYSDLLVLQAHLANQACVADDAAKAYYDAHTTEFEQVCGSVIIVADQAAATAATARLDAGEAFAAVATAVSGDKSAAQGGDIGCKTKGELSAEAIPPFFDTPIGRVSAPTALTSGVVIVKVDSHKQASLDDVRQQASELAATEASSAFQSFIQQAVTAANITVDTRYGTWDAQTGDIVRPPLAGDTSTSVPGTSVPGTSVAPSSPSS